MDCKMIGLSFSNLRDGQNIGYIIPAEKIELFLAGAKAGHYLGKPMMNDEFQTLENVSLRAFLKLPPSSRHRRVQALQRRGLLPPQALGL